MLLGVMDKQDGGEGVGGYPEQSSKVQAGVSFVGPTDLSAVFPAKPVVVPRLVEQVLGGKAADKPDTAKAASPVSYVDKADAPLLMYQGTKDRLVPHTQATLMADAMSSAGMPGRVELLIGADHGWGGPELNRTLEGTLAFFAEHLNK
jgi:dienelactone hydrolase